MAATSTVTQASGHSHTATSTAMKYRTTNSGSPLSHQDVDDNFELLRQAVNGIIGDIDGVVDKDVLTNVPANAVFTDTTYSTATADTAGLVKIGYTESGKNYPVELSSGKMFVNVPWVDTNTTYSTATASTAGLVKIGYSENGRNYPVELSSGKMFVNVPWVDTNTDTNTTYSAGTGLKLSGTTFSLDNSTPTSITSAPDGITGGALTSYRNAGGTSVSTQVAGGWFHYGDAQVEFDPTVFFDVFGNKVPASANWALLTFQMTSTGLDANGNSQSYPAADVSVSLVPAPPQGTSFNNRNTIVRRENQAGTTITTTGQSLNTNFTVGTWASTGGTYSFSSGYQFASTNLFGSGGVTNLATVIVPINHNGSRRSVQCQVQFARDSSGNAVHQYECSGWNLWFTGYLL